MHNWASKVWSQHMFFSFNSCMFFIALLNFVYISCIKTSNHKILFGGDRQLVLLTFLSWKHFKIRSFGMLNCASKSTENMVWWEFTWACKFISHIIWEWLGMNLITRSALSSPTSHTLLLWIMFKNGKNGNISTFRLFQKTITMVFGKTYSYFPKKFVLTFLN
jgi:hypothetical protein